MPARIGAGPAIPRSTTREREDGRLGPDFPDAVSIADGPAALEPNGKVLMMASPYFAPPSEFLEWDGKQPDPDPRSSQRAVRFVLLRQHAGAANRPDLC